MRCDGSTIESVAEYLAIISNIRKRNLAEEDSTIDRQKYFFRGQENSSWDIRPTIFRDGLLTVEASSSSAAYSRNPSEFTNLKTPFERLTKLQHYGLCTRLLDVTLNPLVALYFACQPSYDLLNGEGSACLPTDKDVQRVLRDGVVFYQRAYPYGTNDLETRVISILAETDFGNSKTFWEIIGLISDSGLFTKSEISILTHNKHSRLRTILQSNYFVTSNFTNERLIRQNGAFLLPGCFGVIVSEPSTEKSMVQKAAIGLQREFSDDFFIIASDAKEAIRDELNFYNVNEASLFPELEHQMRYIKLDHARFADPTSVGVFSVATRTNGDGTVTLIESKVVNLEFSNEEFTQIAKWTIEDILKQKKLVDIIVNIVGDNLVVDWYKKPSVISKIKVEITRFLASQPKFDSQTSARVADTFIKQFGSKLGVELEQ